MAPVEYGRSYALRSRRYKYQVDDEGTEALFDLDKDPLEQREISASHPQMLRHLCDITGFYLEVQEPLAHEHLERLQPARGGVFEAPDGAVI